MDALYPVRVMLVPMVIGSSQANTKTSSEAFCSLRLIGGEHGVVVTSPIKLCGEIP